MVKINLGFISLSISIFPWVLTDTAMWISAAGSWQQKQCRCLFYFKKKKIYKDMYEKTCAGLLLLGHVQKT